ncbi:MAG: hypothetical protein GF331_15475 [Chitinivibrionales bacterium]|nr:hypothetical protein [Chitinivibrionales bacterium]
MSLAEVIKTAMDQIQYIAKTETVVGEPIVAGPVTLIPVSRVSVGFAAGGGSDRKADAGAGTGGGINVTPVAMISIVEGKVQVHSMEKEELDLGRLLALAPELVHKLSHFMDKKGDRKKKEEDEK